MLVRTLLCCSSSGDTYVLLFFQVNLPFPDYLPAAMMWVLEKIRTSPGNSNSQSPFLQSVPDKIWGGAAAYPNVLTPDKIPEFCIPPRLTNPAGGPDVSRHQRTPGDCNLCPPGRADRSPSRFLPHIIQVESAEETPVQEEENTNSDPQSQAALSLPHFPKTQTSYGFCTLLESPHIRRKESIFHSDPGSGSLPSLRLPRSRANTYSSKGSVSSAIAIGSARPPPKHLYLPKQGTFDSDTASSADSSPFSSPLLSRSLPRSCPLLKARSQEGLLCRALKAKNISSLGRNNSISTDESSSNDNSPSATRRCSEGLLAPRSFSLSCSPIFPLDLTCGKERLAGESTVLLDRGGLLRLSAEYCSENQRLRIRLVNAEGLYDASVESKNINCCITFSLVPGKIQKQRSTVIKRSRNPIFNEDFFFDGIAEDDLYSFSVRMKAMNKGCNMKRDCILGESELCLMNILSI